MRREGEAEEEEEAAGGGGVCERGCVWPGRGRGGVSQQSTLHMFHRTQKQREGSPPAPCGREFGGGGERMQMPG